MSGNYVYTPQAQATQLPVDYRNSPYLAPFYTQTNSPFIPPMALGGTSPYTPQVALPASSPPTYFNHTPLPPVYVPVTPFPGPEPSSPYVPAYHRERRLSWNGAPPASPYQPDGTTWVRPPPVRQRTRSFEPRTYQTPAPNYNPYFSPAPQSSPYSPYAPPAAETLHPFLNGAEARSDFILDLSLPDFKPCRYMGGNQVFPVPIDELYLPATHPPIYKMTIHCDAFLPGWPINLDFRTNHQYDNNVAPIKVGDVLSAIYFQLHKRITQEDWARLPPHQEHAIAQTFTKRCRALGPSELMMRNQGVKQVDYLVGRHFFKGLVKTGNSFESMRVILG